jgi:hypothetical protein
VLPPAPLLPRSQWAFITVRDFALPPGRVYAFTLTALDISGLTAAATVTVEVNAPPTAGAVSVFPTWGYALVTGRVTNRKGYRDLAGCAPFGFCRPLALLLLVQRVVCTMGCAHDNCCWLLLLEFMEAAQKLGGDSLAWLSLPMELLVPAWFNSCE